MAKENPINKIKVTIKKDSEMVKMVDTMKADKQDFKNRVESGEFSGSYMKQTAVEFLIEQLQAPCRGIPSDIIEQAKQMEKEQIINAYKNGQKIVEQYYNETYGKKISND